MNILILGGSGILSTDFTLYALSQADELYILNRGKRAMSAAGNHVHRIIADLRAEDIQAVREKIPAIHYDVVVDFLSFNVEQLRKSLEIVVGRYTQYVFISSATAYIKRSENDIITERNEVGNQAWEYALHKAECEHYLQTTDTNYTIIRPYVTFGDTRIPFPIIPDGYHYTLLERIKEGKPVLLYNGGEAVCTLTSTKDFAVILYRLLLNEKAYRQDFHITSSFRQTWKEIYLTYCRILNCTPNVLSVSIDEINRYLPEFSSILQGDKGTNMRFDNTKVLDAIGGYGFDIPLYERLRSSVEYFETHPAMQAIDNKWDGRCDYLIRRVTGQRLLPLHTTDNNDSNARYWYYVMSVAPFRHAFETAKSLKRKVRGRAAG